MNENGTKRREWVKTAAIIFLSVMLVLTFFSQTILNYSLPEVATQYVQSGSITAKIRGTGTIESGDPYEIKVTESRKVSSVAVRVGDTVQKGDVLLYLEDAESDELKTARTDLENAENEYELALLKSNITSSQISSANKDVSTETYRRQLTNAQSAVQKAENAVTAAENELEAAKAAVTPLENRVAEVQNTIDAYTLQIAHDSDPDVKARSEQRVKDAEAAKGAAKNKLSDAETAKNNAATELKTAQENLANVSGGDVSTLQSIVATKQHDYDTAVSKFNEAQNAYNTAQKNWEEADKSEKNREAAVKNLSAGKADWILQKGIYEKDVTAAKAVVAEKEAALEKAKAEVAEKQSALDKLAGNIDNVIVLEQMLDKIEKARKKVDELLEKAVDATIKADISGTVTAINVTAGNMTSAATPVAVLQPEGKGYTLSFSVTNEQAKRLSVGDRADLINAWRYDDVEATLASIKPDRENPGQKKMLTFDITGQVVAGQTLNLSVGQKSANFDLIVPNSAIREDGNGKFILIVESRPSPLGNRYIATRVDVEVIASDDTQSAISGALYGYEYVITTSTKPVEAGKQVRLADN